MRCWLRSPPCSSWCSRICCGFRRHPSFPPGGGSDLTHHLLLVDYIEEHGRLVHDPAAGVHLGEMADYTPGVHLLAVIAGALVRSDGFHAIYSIIAAMVALKAGYVLLIAWRLLPPTPARLPLALLAVVIVFAASAYSLGSFLVESFLAQVAAELFAVAAWWALVVWDQRPESRVAALASAWLAATFLTWPIWIGPLVVVLTVLSFTHRERLGDVAIALVPLAIVAVVHVAGRASSTLIVQTSGAVLQPTLAVLGWWVPPLVIVSVVVIVRGRPYLAVTALLAAISLQAAALFAVAERAGAATPYMTIKMIYLAVYPVAVAGAIAIGSLLRWRVALASIVMIIAATMTARDLSRRSGPPPIVSDDLHRAGLWTRERVSRECIDYLVGNEYTAYWLHLAVLRNPRASERTADNNTFLTQPIIERWLTSQGRPYAIADLRVLPAEIRNDANVVAQYGDAAVISSRRAPVGDGACEYHR